MADIKCSRAASFTIFMISLSIFAISFGTSFWANSGTDFLNTRHGLWRICLELDDSTKCGKIESASSDLKSTRAMMCIAVIFYILSFILYSVWMCKGETYLKQYGAGGVGKGALSMALIGAIFNIIGVAVFGSLYADNNTVLHFSFAFAVISGVVMFFNSVITLGTTACCYTRQSTASTTMTIITTQTPSTNLVQNYTNVQQAPVQYPPPQATAYTGVQTTYPPQPGAISPQQYQYPPQPGPYPQQAMPNPVYPQQVNLQYPSPAQQYPPQQDITQYQGPPPPYQEVTQATAPPAESTTMDYKTTVM